MSNINDVPMVMVPLSSLFIKIWHLAYGRTGVRTDVRTDSHVTTKIFAIDGLPNFLRYGAPLVHLRCAGAPLLERMHYNSERKAEVLYSRKA